MTGAVPEVGDLAPEIDLPRADSSRWCLSDARGHPVVLIFHRHLH